MTTTHRCVKSPWNRMLHWQLDNLPEGRYMSLSGFQSGEGVGIGLYLCQTETSQQRMFLLSYRSLNIGWAQTKAYLPKLDINNWTTGFHLQNAFDATHQIMTLPESEVFIWFLFRYYAAKCKSYVGWSAYLPETAAMHALNTLQVNCLIFSLFYDILNTCTLLCFVEVVVFIC